MKKHDWKTGLRLVAVGTVLGLAVGSAVAAADSPGWIWGRANCAPWSTPPKSNVTTCNTCCAGAPAAQLFDCLAFCGQVNWPLWAIIDPNEL